MADWLVEQGLNLDVAKELEEDLKRESKLAVKAVGRYRTYLQEIKGDPNLIRQRDSDSGTNTTKVNSTAHYNKYT